MKSPWDIVAIPMYWGLIIVLTIWQWLRPGSAVTGFGETRKPSQEQKL